MVLKRTRRYYTKKNLFVAFLVLAVLNVVVKPVSIIPLVGPIASISVTTAINIAQIAIVYLIAFR